MRARAICAAVGVLFASGCGGGSTPRAETVASSAASAEVEARLRVAGALPDSVLAAAWTADLAGLVAHLGAMPADDEGVSWRLGVAAHAIRAFGFDPTRLDALEAAGVDVHGPVALGWLGDGVVVAVRLGAPARFERLALEHHARALRPSGDDMEPPRRVEGATIYGSESSAILVRESRALLVLGDDAATRAVDFASSGKALTLASSPRFLAAIRALGEPSEVEVYADRAAFQTVAGEPRGEWVAAAAPALAVIEAEHARALEDARRRDATVSEIAAIDAAFRARRGNVMVVDETNLERRRAAGIDALACGVSFDRDGVGFRGEVLPATSAGSSPLGQALLAAAVQRTVDAVFEALPRPGGLRPEKRPDGWAYVAEPRAAASAPSAPIDAPNEGARPVGAPPSSTDKPATLPEPPPMPPPSARDEAVSRELALIQRELVEVDRQLAPPVRSARRRPTLTAARVRISPRWRQGRLQFDGHLVIPRGALVPLLAELRSTVPGGRSVDALEAALERRRGDLTGRRDELLDRLYAPDVVEAPADPADPPVK